MNERNESTDPRREAMLLDATERYLRQEMTTDERARFEELRRTDADVDQLVVEHALFLQQLAGFGDRSGFRDTLQEVHQGLTENDEINDDELAGKAKVVYLWNRYKRVTAIAASIAGIVAISFSSLVNSIAPKAKDAKVEALVSENRKIKGTLIALDEKIENVDRKTTGAHVDMVPRFNGTGFLIDAKGLMITNAHVVSRSKNFYVQNNKGEQFKAIVLKLDVTRDVAIIKIDDDAFRPLASLPYGIRKQGSEIAESIFTLGFPRDEIVYGEGYLSARTGFNGDTLSCQISVDANPGNSGGPVFNRNGEVIGILSARQREAEGAVFAVQSKYIYSAVEELKRNSLYEKVYLSGKSSVSKLDKVDQVKKIRDCVFMVKAD